MKEFEFNTFVKLFTFGSAIANKDEPALMLAANRRYYDVNYADLSFKIETYDNLEMLFSVKDEEYSANFLLTLHYVKYNGQTLNISKLATEKYNFAQNSSNYTTTIKSPEYASQITLSDVISVSRSAVRKLIRYNKVDNNSLVVKNKLTERDSILKNLFCLEEFHTEVDDLFTKIGHNINEYCDVKYELNETLTFSDFTLCRIHINYLVKNMTQTQAFRSSVGGVFATPTVCYVTKIVKFDNNCDFVDMNCDEVTTKNWMIEVPNMCALSRHFPVQELEKHILNYVKCFTIAKSMLD